MPNSNDYQPGSGKVVKSDGSVINEGDGYNTDGSQNVVVLPIKVQEFVLINGLTITDTSAHQSAIIDISALAGMKNLLIYNALNQTATVTIFIKTLGGLIFNIGAPTVGAGATKILTDIDYPILKHGIQQIQIQVSCSTAPTSGTVSVVLEGLSA